MFDIEQELRRIIEDQGGAVKMDNPWWMVGRIRAMFDEQQARLVEAAVQAIESHSCVASCCDAQPSAGEAKQLAQCVKQTLMRALTRCDRDCICGCHDNMKGVCLKCSEARKQHKK